MYEIYLQSFVLYFVVIDPFGTTPIFMSLTKHQNAKEKIKSALEGVLTATIILIFFSIVGNFLLSYLNISLGAFKIAGGIILFIIYQTFIYRLVWRINTIAGQDICTRLFPRQSPELLSKFHSNEYEDSSNCSLTHGNFLGNFISYGQPFKTNRKFSKRTSSVAKMQRILIN